MTTCSSRWLAASTKGLASVCDTTDKKVMARYILILIQPVQKGEVSLPAVITVSNELGESRYPKLKGMMTAKKIDPIVWNAADINVQPSQVGDTGRKSKLVRLYERPLGDMCEFVHGESPEEAGANLALKLRESKIL